MGDNVSSKWKRVIAVLVSLGAIVYLLLVHMGAGMTVQELQAKKDYDRVVAADGTITLADRQNVKAIIFNPPEYRLEGTVYTIPANGDGFVRERADFVYNSDIHEIVKEVLEVRIFYANGMVNIPATMMAEEKLVKPAFKTIPGSADYASGIALFWANYKVDFLGAWE